MLLFHILHLILLKLNKTLYYFVYFILICIDKRTKNNVSFKTMVI